MDQPIPQVTAVDIERLVQRDFPPHARPEILQILRQHHDDNLTPRVQAAVLKCASGDTGKLHYYVNLATTDYRDVIALAEYPEYMKSTVQQSDEVRQDMIRRDWAQFKEWFNATIRPK